VIAKEKQLSIAVCLVLAFGTALLYAPVLHFDFVNYDDPLYVINNLYIRNFNGQFLSWCFQTTYAFMWHPLTWMSHALDYQLYGLQYPGGHHATSLILHIFNSTLLFVILHRMTKALWRSAVVAALFAWHPLHVESVAWVTERKDVLCAFFWLLTMWAYVRYAEERKQRDSDPTAVGRSMFAPREQSNRARSCSHAAAPISGKGATLFYALALIFFALGSMSKAMIVTLPFVLLLLDWWPLQRMQVVAKDTEKSGAPGNSPLPMLILEKIPFFAMSAVVSALAMRAASRAITSMSDFPLQQRLVTAVVMYFRYIKIMVWPKDMVVAYPSDYPYPPGEVVASALFLIAISIVAIRLRNKRPFWVVGWFSYLGVLFPVIGLVQVGGPPMADRYTYLSFIGLFMIVCWEGWDIATGWLRGRAVAATTAGLALGMCCVISSKQIQYWRNPAELHLHRIAVMPNNSGAHADYAIFLRDDRQLAAAHSEAETAVRLDVNSAWAHQALGGVLLLQGQLAQANEELHTVLRLDPKRLDAHMALAAVAIAQNHPDEAVKEYQTVLAVQPFNAEAHCWLGQAFSMSGKLDEAQVQQAEALRLAPAYAEAHHQMAVLLSARHRVQDAISEYQTALKLQPNRPDTLNNLGWILATDPRSEIRQGVQAVDCAYAACTLTHEKSPMMLGTLAAAYAEAGKFDDAVAAGMKAHDLAVAQGNTNLAALNLKLVGLYRQRQPYHEK
jgi:Tfp pilus assembly protein PilF